jgi:hypothetical protein
MRVGPHLKNASSWQLTHKVAAGATAVLDETSFPEAKDGTALLGPTVLVNVDHSKCLPLARRYERTRS